VNTCRLAALLALGIALGSVAVSNDRPAAQLLLITHGAAYEHDVVRRPGSSRPSIVEQVVTDLGRRSGFTVTCLQSANELATLTPASIRQFRAVLFFTTGSVPLPSDTRLALFEHVWNGAGFIGVHSATDTWYEVPEYATLLGGVFDGHPWHERVHITVEDSSHAATAHLGSAFWLTDEIYQFRNWSRGAVHVLLRLDLTSIAADRGSRRDADYALAWTRPHGQGRVFYTALGHRPDVWADAGFRQHLLGGILWTMGR
jgi:type 1 glutamine amidotransferase